MNISPGWQTREALLRCAALLLIIRLISACTPLDMLPGCDQGALAVIVTECREKVRAQCRRGADGLPESSCPVLIDCDKRIDSWEECR
jgi:hypothetical protein